MATLYKDAQDTVEELQSRWYEVQIYQDMTEDRKDSFWYDWAIMSLTRNWTTLTFAAHWEVLVRNSFWVDVYDKDNISENKLPFDYYLWTDENLVKMFSNNDFHYVFNNWFAIYDESYPQDDIVCDSLEDFIQNLPE